MEFIFANGDNKTEKFCGISNLRTANSFVKTRLVLEIKNVALAEKRLHKNVKA